VREGVWVRPDNLPRDAGAPAAWTVADAQCAWWQGTPEEDPVALARQVFDSDAWATRASDLDATLNRATEDLGSGDDNALPRAFEAGAAALAHIRRDPLLPGSLCPSPWPGARLRASYRTYRRAFGDTVAAWFRTPG
jgi:phenylacetic acid degradation operon negative regulatory protein